MLRRSAPPKSFVRFAKGEHEGFDAHGAIAAVRDFLAAAPAELRWAGKDMGQWSVPRDLKTAARSTRVLDSGCSRLPK